MRSYENLKIFWENRLPQRSYYIPYESLEKALEGNRNQSQYYHLLNGNWDFAFYERDFDLPEDIGEICFDATIPVPSCWQNHGYEKPYYTNQHYPYPVDPPYVPDENPCGIYHTKFTLNEDWTDRDTHIVFEGDPHLRIGTFGTASEAQHSGFELYQKMPAVLYPKAENITVTCQPDSKVAAYCKEYGIPMGV